MIQKTAYSESSSKTAASSLPIHFRYFKKNTYSYSALIPVVSAADFVTAPASGIMLYSFFTNQKEAVFNEVRQARESEQISKRTSEVPSFFIAGGPHPSGAPQETLSVFDAVVIGEGEQTLPFLLSKIEENHRLGIDLKNGFENISGIAFKNIFGEIVLTAPAAPVSLDCYPCFAPDNIWRPLELSRGCPHRCKFCQTPQLFGHQMRHRSVSEILKYASYYDDLRFISSNAFAYGGNGVSPKYEKVKELLSALFDLGGKRIFFGTFPSEVRPEFVTEEMIGLVETYCTNTSLSIGAQSGSDTVLQEIRRGHSAEDVYNAAEICFSHKITPIVDFIIGFPGETEKDQQQSLDMIDWLCQKGGEVRAHYLTPLPSTDYENIVPANVHPEISRKLGKLALGGKLKGTWENLSHDSD